MVAKNYSDEVFRSSTLDNEVSELTLLLPSSQMDALEQVARSEGLTVAQLLRRHVNKMLAQASPRPSEYYYS